MDQHDGWRDPLASIVTRAFRASQNAESGGCNVAPLGGCGLGAERDSLPRSEGGVWGVRRSTLGGCGLGAVRDSLPRSEGGVWGVRRSPPQNKLSRVLPLCPEFVQDPGFYTLGVRAVAFDGTQVVEEAALVAGAEGAAREGDVDLALGRAPEREPDQLHPGERTRLRLEHDLCLAHDPFRRALPHHEIDSHRNLLLVDWSRTGERPGPSSLSRGRARTGPFRALASSRAPTLNSGHADRPGAARDPGLSGVQDDGRSGW